MSEWTPERKAEAAARLKAGREAKKEQKMPDTQDTSVFEARIAKLEAEKRALAAQIENAGSVPQRPPGIGARRIAGMIRVRPEHPWTCAQMVIDADIYREQFIKRCDEANICYKFVVVPADAQVKVDGWPSVLPATTIGAMDYARTGEA